MEIEQVRRERDFYLRLLELGSETELEVFLREALALVVELTGATHGYLELAGGRDGEGPRWSMAQGFDDAEVAGVRSTISRGIVAEAFATGETVLTSSALLDPRFRERESVRIGKIEAVLCVPIGTDPCVGALYLQGRKIPGPFTTDDQRHAELFARQVATIGHRLLAVRYDGGDPTEPFRARMRLDGLIGRSAALGALLRQVSLVVPIDVSVLLTGGSGTGKSQIARIIHDNGPRAGAPFVDLNCAALPEALVESELFGALPGAHSTATRRIDGKVAAAQGGTLFLDEVGELSLAAQAKLLHLLQSKQYYPLGASKPVEADVRVIAATNIDLQAAVADHRFREDLLYRLEVLPIRVPSLAERREDVPILADHFAARACQRHRLPLLPLSLAAQRALESAEWPGNVRQLEHAVEAAAIRAAGDGAACIEQRYVFPGTPANTEGSSPSTTFQEATRGFQASLLQRALKEADWNVTEVARKLDLTRSHVYSLIKAFAIRRG